MFYEDRLALTLFYYTIVLFVTQTPSSRIQRPGSILSSSGWQTLKLTHHIFYELREYHPTLALLESQDLLQGSVANRMDGKSA